MKKFNSIFFSMAVTAVLMIIFAVAIGYATFVEKDSGAAVARDLVYNAKWFEILLTLLCINMLGSLFKYKSFQNKKYSLIVFHLSFIVIIIGAGITRYYSHEGIMHIREQESSNIVKTTNTNIKININGEEIAKVNTNESLEINKLEPIELNVNGKSLKITQSGMVYQAAKMVRTSMDGMPTISLLTSDSVFHYNNTYLRQGENYSFGNVDYGFNNDENNDIRFIVKNDTLYYISSKPTFSTSTNNALTHQKFGPDTLRKVNYNTVYQYGWKSFLVKKYYPYADIDIVSMRGHGGNYPVNALLVDIEYDNNKLNGAVFGSANMYGDPLKVKIGDLNLVINYGPENIELPFSIKLDDFILERYANSNSPSSFKSIITLTDEKEGLVQPYEIFMNNILNYKGYRFFQSSYDSDEAGTILSVNYDPIGTKVTYFGYFFMALGMFLAVFSKKSYFMELAKRGSKAVAILLLIAFSSTIYAQEAHTFKPMPPNNIDAKHAEKFGKILIADPRGRIKPVHTFASEIMRKISRESTFKDYSPTQLFISLLVNQSEWEDVAIIKIGNSELKKKYNITTDKISINYMLRSSNGGRYLLKNEVEHAYEKPASERTKYDKELLKLDERINICSMVFTGRILHIFPVPSESTNKWTSANESMMMKNASARDEIISLYTKYYSSIKKAIASHDWSDADIALDNIIDYQKNNAIDLPSETKINAEIFYNKLNYFGNVSFYYLGFGLVLLLAYFIKIFYTKLKINWLIKTSLTIIILLFAGHTFVLGLRWYISGHAPWSNGYETTLFIAWATVLSGLFFAKRSKISLAVTAIIAAILILISSLSWMDPEITNLVPVLKSYWLIIHVAVITSSYGFFALTMLLGLINTALILFKTRSNENKLSPQILEISTIIQMANIIGLYLLTIGTFLGAVWANESWGRYWGWDPKETWALVTILVYSIFMHLRHIPVLKSEYVVSASSVLAFSSVLMTYFGVNFFLTGMHSYASGDSFKIPISAIIITLFIVLLIFVTGVKHFRGRLKS